MDREISGVSKNNVLLVDEWVKGICGPEYGDHHGHDHAKTVSEIASQIYHDMVGRNKIGGGLDGIVRIIGLLHDVDDSKIDTDMSKKALLNQFLQENFPDHNELIRNVIDRISYSKEVKMRKEMGNGVDWMSVLGPTGTLIRNIVSDADKLESLGVEGFNRSKEYNKGRLSLGDSKEDERKLYEAVNEIIESKLMRLHEYLYTDLGKEMGRERTAALLDAHRKWRAELLQ